MTFYQFEWAWVSKVSNVTLMTVYSIGKQFTVSLIIDLAEKLYYYSAFHTDRGFVSVTTYHFLPHITYIPFSY